jgi:hypothetical protein
VEPFGQRLNKGLGARGIDAGKAHAVGGKQAGKGVQMHGGHAQRVGNGAGVLTASAAEAVSKRIG